MESLRQVAPAASEAATMAADLASATAYFEVGCWVCVLARIHERVQQDAGRANAVEACATARLVMTAAAGAGLQAGAVLGTGAVQSTKHLDLS